MDKQVNLKMHAVNDDEDIASVTELLGTLWQSRWKVIALTSLIVVGSAAVALYNAQYRSEAFFQFGGAIPMSMEKKLDNKEPAYGIGLADYKRYAASFATSERFADFTQSNKLAGAPGIDQLRRIFIVPNAIDRFVEPVYPFTKLDAKELEQPREGSNNNVIGLRLNYEAGTPESAQRTVGLLGRFIMDSIMYLTYADSLRFKSAEINSKITRLDNNIIENNERLEEYLRKGASLKEVVSRYPESAMAARQVVSVTEDNARYLSPVTQLMTSEVQVSEIKEVLYRFKRERQQNILLREYYNEAKKLLDETKSGEIIVRGLEPIKERIFKGKDLNDQTIKEVYNTITIDNQNASSLYLEKSRFIAGPSLPERRSTRLSMVVVMSGLIGLLLSVILVFGSKWWRENRQKMGA